MSVTPKATTELEAVNIMLSAIGESPVSSLGGGSESNADVVTAKRILLETSKEIQSEGWWYGIEEDYDFTADANGEIEVPSNAIRVDADTETDFDVVLRGLRLYDKKDHTFNFGANTVVTCEVLFLHPYDELPETARYYIAVKAARKFQDRVVGSDNLHGYNAEDEARARAKMSEEDGDAADHNILTGSEHSVRILNRQGFRRYVN